MKLKSMSIKNFRCHELIDDMPIHDITTLIGENDSGKTSVIDFMELMLTNKITCKEDYYKKIDCLSKEETVASTIEGIFKFEFTEEEVCQYKDYINENKEFLLKKVFTKNEADTYIMTKSFEDDRLNRYKELNVIKWVSN